jgi:hypothetical protein
MAAFGGNNTSGPIDVATARNAHGGPHGRLDFETETLIAHSLRADGFDASEDGTGRDTPLVAEEPLPILEVGKRTASGGVGRNGDGIGEPGDPMFTLQAGAQHAVAVKTSRTNANGANVSDDLAFTIGSQEAVQAIAHALDAHSADGTGRGPPLVAIPWEADDVADPLTASEGKTYTHEGSRNFRLHNVVADVAIPQASAPGAVFTLAVRGRADGHQLEFRQDELANAILTPCGGRAGIGVGAVAFMPDLADPIIAVEAKTWTHEGSHNFRPRNLIAFDAAQVTSLENRSNPQAGDPAPTLAEGGQPMVAFNITPSQSNKDFNARASDRGDVILPAAAVRRLTPTECARLQGFPDDYLDIEFRGKPATDGPKYKALGNSFATPVVRWIGERIAAVSP